ncbi:MAG TPA: pitrilysin family protein [Usitatibacter sp.]|nr:pitrilysin family protein [Usitatibacter sp.]
MRATSLLISIAALLAAASCATPEKVAGTFSSAQSPAAQFVAGVRRTVLPNGLTVLTHEKRGSGVVAINTWVKAGYFHEPDEVAGMAHLFEHMFFKGSKAFPEPESIAQAVSAAGGGTNAGTIYDSTNYYVVVPKENFAKGVEIQADAIAHPLFDAAELKKEAEVVIEESNRKLDNAGAVAFERMIATSYTQHRVRRWRIGSNEVLRNIRRDNLVAFFETLYRPENIIVSVAGDVSHEEALAVVSRNYGSIPRGTLTKKRGPAEPVQTAFRFGRSEADVKEGYTVLGWHTVPENHADEVSLEVLAGILGSGRSSRFYRAVVGPKGASTASASHLTFDDVGFFAVTASHPEANREQVERGVVAEIERMKRFGPTAYELAQSKNVRQSEFLAEMETGLDQAQMLSQYEARGSYRDIDAKLSRLDAVTVEQVRDAARRYLTTPKLTLYHYQPKGSAAVDAAAALARINAAEAVAVTAPEALPLPDTRNTVRTAAADAPAQSFALSNGATLVVQQRTASPTVSTGLFFRGGRIGETAANAGITRLMQATMRRGTASRSAEAVDRDIEFLGGRLGSITQPDGFGFTFDSVARFYEPALRVVADVLLNPSFPAQEITREKALQLAALRRSQDSSLERPEQLLRAAMFGGHPYGLSDRGTEATLSALDRPALQVWWKSNVAGERAMIVVVGNVSAEDVRRVMEEQLAALPRSAPDGSPAVARAVPDAPRESIEERDRKQTAMMIGFPIVSASHPDWPALRMIQAVTSGLSGTFFAELRSRQSLAYTVFARPQSFARQGLFVGYLAGDASKEAQARAALLAEIRKLQGEGIKADDLARAKAFYAGSTRRSREGNAPLVIEYGGNYLLGLPLDNVDRILAAVPGLTVADLQRVAREQLAGDNYVYAAVRGKS